MLVDGGMNRSGLNGEALEAAGYDGAWCAEMDNDPFLPLAVAADHTDRLQLGTGIAVAFARSPMTLAQTARDLQVRSEGRFLLGLGSQIEPHITKRFSMPWSRPVDRMREYVAALRAIWACWDGEGPLDFRGDFYQHTLMTPMFDPGPNPHGPPPVILAAVGPRMTEMAGEVADGLFLHGFTTADYARSVTLPAVERGRERAGLGLDGFVRSIPAMVVTGTDEASMAASDRAVRKQLAFYGSTPAYRAVLDHHGWGDLQPELNRLSKQGEWDAMADLIDDEVVAAFAVVAEPRDVAAGLRERWAGVATRLSFYAPYDTDPDTWLPVIEDLKKGA